MAAQRQHGVGGDQHGQAGNQQDAVADAVGQLAKGVGRQRVHRVHRHQRQRHQRHRHARLLGAQHQKRLGEACQREQPAHQHHAGIGRAQATQVGAADRVAAADDTDGGAGRSTFGFRRRPGWLFHAPGQQQYRAHGRDDGHPEHRSVVLLPEQHQCHGQQRAAEGPHRVERLAQSERRTALAGRSQIGHQGVARCAPNAFAHAVDQPCRDHHPQPAGQRKQGLAERPQAVAQQRQTLAPAQPIAERAREHLDDQRGGLGQAFDQAHRQGAGTQHADHVHRQQAVDHLGRDVHQQADETQHPDAGGQRGLTLRLTLRRARWRAWRLRREVAHHRRVTAHRREPQAVSVLPTAQPPALSLALPLTSPARDASAPVTAWR